MATTDITAQILTATAATQIALTGGSYAVALPAGTTTFAGTFTGDGSITLTSDSAAGGALLLADGTRFALPSPGTTVVLTRSGGAWSVDYSKALLANKNIVLTEGVGATATINGNSTITYTGAISGEGRLALTSTNGFLASLTLGAGGPTFNLARGNYANNTLTAILDDGAWSEDVTTAVLTGRNVAVTVPAIATLPAGTSTMAGTLTVAGGATLIVKSSDAAGGSTLTLANGTQLVLGAPGQSAIVTQPSGVLTIDQTSALLKNQNIVLAAKTVVTLPAGTTAFTGTISGAGSLTVTAGSAGSALKLPDGSLVKLTVPGQTVAISQINGVWTTDVTGALLANQDIVLTGPATARLPLGTFNYTGKITGAGNLTLNANSKGASTLQLADGTRFVLPAGGINVAAVLGSSGWTIDVTTSLQNGWPVILTVPATATLPAGKFDTRSLVTGSGTLTVIGNAASASTFNLYQNPEVLMTLTAPGQTQTATLSKGTWTTDLSSAIRADRDIVLSGQSTATIMPGREVYTGKITGSGTLLLTTGGAGGGSLRLPNNTMITLPEANQTALARFSGGTWTLDVTASIVKGQDITLSSVNSTVVLPAGVTRYAGTVSGLGTLVLTSSAAGGSTFDFGGGISFTLPQANTTVTAFYSEGQWQVDVTAALKANQDIALNPNIRTFASLPNRSGITYTGKISGEGDLMLSGNSTFLKTADKTWVLPTNQNLLSSLSDGAWMTDITDAIVNNANIQLDGSSVLFLEPGITRYTGQIFGSGTLRIVGSYEAGGTIDFRGNTIAMPGPGQELIATFVAPPVGAGQSVSSSVSVNYTPVVASGVDIYLEAPGVVDLPPGVTAYDGRIYGAGNLTLRTGIGGGAAFKLADGQTFVLPVANETVVFRLANSKWTMDATDPVSKGQPIVLTTDAIVTVPTGNTLIKATGSGKINFTGDLKAGSTIQIEGGPKIVIPPAHPIPPNTNLVSIPVSATLADGRWITDFSYLARNNYDIVLDGPTVFSIDDGSYVNYSGKITGKGTVGFVNQGPNETAITLADGTRFNLAGGQSINQMTLRFDGAAWTADVTEALLANDNISLTIATTIGLPAGLTTYTGNLFDKRQDGKPVNFTLNGSPAGSTLTVNGSTFVIPAGGSPLNVTIDMQKTFSVDLTSNIRANTPIALTGIPSSVTLPAGTTIYNAQIQGDGALTLRTGTAGGGTLILADGTRLVLAAPNETVTVTKSGGAWTMDVSAAIAANQDVVLTGNAIATLAAGAKSYTGKITGTGTLVIKAANAGGGSTITLADGTKHVLGTNNQTETLIVTNGAVVTDISQEIAARQAAFLSGNAVLRLPAGTLSVPAITGAGKIVVTAADSAGGSTLLFSNGTSLVLPAAGQTITATLSGGAWTTDVTAAILANQPITLTGNAVATLPAGVTSYSAAITGTGKLTLTKSGASSTLVLADGTDFALGSANPSETITLDRGAVTVDIGAALKAGQNIALDGSNVATLPAGTLAYAGTLTGAGLVRLVAGGSASTLTLKDGTTINVPANGAITLAYSQPGDPVDVGAILSANGNLVLHGPATMTVGSGTLNHTGTVTGSGTIAIASTAASGSSRVNIGGVTGFQLAAGGQATAIFSGGRWTLDATTLLKAGKVVDLSMPTVASLPAGTTDFAAGFSGTGKVVLTAPASGGATLRLPNGASIVIPEAGESLTVSLSGNTVTAIDASAALAAGHDIALGPIPISLTLPAGTTTYAGALLGTGSINLTSAAAGSTLKFANGTTYTLPVSGETITLNVSPSGVVADVTAAILANQSLVLTGQSVAALPGGSRAYTGTITGSGTLTLTSPANNWGQLVVGSAKLTMLDAGSTLVATFSNGAWSADVTQMLLANKRISLDVPSTATVPAGVTVYTGGFQQKAPFTVTSATGNSTVRLPDGTSLVLSAPGSSAVVGLNNGPTTVDVSAMLTARQPVVLTARTTARIAGGTLDLTGLVTGDGALTVKTTAAANIVFGPGTGLTIPANGAAKISRIGGVWAPDVTAAFQAGQPIALGGTATLDLAAGANRFSGTGSGNGRLVVTASAANSSLVMPDGTSFTFAPAGQTQTITQVGGVWRADATQALLANQNITLSGPTFATLPAGLFRYNGNLNGNSPLTLTSSEPNAIFSLRGRGFVLAGGEATIRGYDGQWTLDVTAALTGGKPIAMNGQTVATLSAGTTTYPGSFSGIGTLVLIAPKTGSASLVLPGGKTITVAANTTQSATLVDGVIATDITAAIAANQAVTLAGPSVIQIGAGTTTYTGTLGGSGTLVLKTGKSGGGTLVLADGTTFALPSANETVSATKIGAAWVLDVSNAIMANQSVTLAGKTVATLPTGTFAYLGTLAGNGTLTLTSKAGGSRLQFADGTVHVLGAAGQSEIVTIAGGKIVSTDVTAAILADQSVVLAGAMTASLKAGLDTYSGTLSGSGTLSLTSSVAGGSTFVLADGTRFVLTGANETIKATLAGGAWTTDYSQAIAGNFALQLSGASTATLRPGTTTLTRPISGDGTLRLTSSATGGSTLVLADGTRFTLPVAGETATAVLKNGAWTLDVTAAILANQEIVLTGHAVAALPGPVNYTGKITGTGTLALTSPATRDASLTLATTGTVFRLPSAGETQTAALANGVWTVDVTAAMLANQTIAFTVPATFTLPAGNTVYTGSVSGNGALTLVSPTGGSTLTLNGATYVLGDAGEAVTVTYTNGVPVIDVTAALKGNHPIELVGTSVATIGAGTTTFTAAIAGDGVLKVTSSAANAVLKLPNGGSATLQNAGTTVTLSLSGGVWTTDVSAAIAANKAIVLSGQTVAALPAGSFNYTGGITGNGTLKLVSANAANGSVLTIPGKTFILPSGNETYVATLTNGAWSLDVTAAILANQWVTLNGAASVALPSGITNYRGTIAGSGALLLSSGADGATLQIGGNRFVLAGKTSAVASFDGAAWTIDQTATLVADKDIVLNGATVVTLGAGLNDYTGTLSGTGTLTLKGATSGPSSLKLADGSLFTLAVAGQTQVVTFANGGYTTNVSAALLGNQAIALSDKMVATLGTGTLVRTAAITGAGALKLASGPNGGGTLVLSDGTHFVLSGANQTVTATKTAAGWSTDVSALIATGAAIVVNGATTATLPTGTTTLSAAITGTGSLTLTASRTGASTLVLANGSTFTLPVAGGTGTLKFSGSGAPVFDISAAIAANQNIALTGTALAGLPAGLTGYTGTITGTGKLVLTSPADAASTLTLKTGQSFVLPVGGETVTASFANGAWTTDITAAILANQNVTLTGDTVINLPSGTRTYTGSITGDGTLTVYGPASGTATLNGVSGATFTLGNGIATAVIEVSAGHGTVDITQAVTGNKAVTLNGTGFITLPAGATSYAGAITGKGTLTLLGSAAGDSTVTLAGGQSFTVPKNGAIALDRTASGWVASDTVDITAAIRAGQSSIVFSGKRYVIDIPAGETISYNGVMSGTGTLRITGGGSLILNKTSTFTLPPDQLTQHIAPVNTRPMDFHGIMQRAQGGGVFALQGDDPPTVIVDKGASLYLGDPKQNNGVGNIANYANGHGISYNLTNIQVNGKLDINYWGGEGYMLPLGKISGDGLLTNNIGSIFAGGVSTFTGHAHMSGFNIGNSHGGGSFDESPNIGNGFVLAFGGMPASYNGGPNGEATDGYTVIPQDIFEFAYGNSIHNIGGGVLVFAGQYHYSDSPDYLNPSLSNPLLDYMTLPGNASHRRFFSAGLRQFGDGTDADFFMPGNEVTTFFNADGTTAFNYNGVVRMNGIYGHPGAGDAGNVIIVGTEGNHIIFTQPTYYNGITLINENAVLQLGDGTLGNGETITTTDAKRGTVTGWYSTSGGNGSIMTAESPSGAPTDEIRLNGELILMNTVGARSGVGQETLSSISGTGDLTQAGNQTVTLLHNTVYTGKTNISNGILALGLYGDISSSSGVFLKNAAATFDISQASDSTIRSIDAASESTIALGGHTLTVLADGTSRIAGSLVDGGLGGGAGGGLIMAGRGVLQLAGVQSYTGATSVVSGVLRLGGASLASGLVTIASGASLGGTGDVAGRVINDGVLRVENGMMTVAGDIGGAGSIVIGDGGVLTLSGASSQTIAFEGSGLLRLTDPDGFTGLIVGFDGDSRIELPGIADPVPSFSQQTGILSVRSGSQIVASLRFDAAARIEGVSIVVDADGGVRVVDADADLVADAVETIYLGDGQNSVALSGPSVKIVGGAGETTVTGGAGRSEIVANQAQMTVSGGSGAMTFIGGSAAATVTTGTGGLDFTAGTGDSTVTAGSGVDVFSFVAGLAGGVTVLQDFTPGVDKIKLQNYSAASLDQSLSQTFVSSGSLIVELSDHTRLHFAGASSVDRSSFQIV